MRVPFSEVIPHYRVSERSRPGEEVAYQRVFIHEYGEEMPEESDWLWSGELLWADQASEFLLRFVVMAHLLEREPGRWNDPLLNL